MLTPEEFYDNLAGDYDAMTQFAARLEKEKRTLGRVLERLPSTRAIDMGCGTGVHTVALAQLGVDVIGIDLSSRMLERARIHADSHAALHSAPVRFIQGNFLTALPTVSADLILSLGNSIPHISSRDSLRAVFAHWHGLLAEGGQVLLQLLNYRDVLRRGERIVGIRRESGKTIVRFYDFLDDALQFNILTIIDDAPDGPAHSLRSTRLSPFTDGDIATAAVEAGFDTVEKFGAMDFSPFIPDSRNLVAVLR